jgi:hypothetical protein
MQPCIFLNHFIFSLNINLLYCEGINFNVISCFCCFSHGSNSLGQNLFQIIVLLEMENLLSWKKNCLFKLWIIYLSNLNFLKNPQKWSLSVIRMPICHYSRSSDCICHTICIRSFHTLDGLYHLRRLNYCRWSYPVRNSSIQGPRKFSQSNYCYYSMCLQKG